MNGREDFPVKRHGVTWSALACTLVLLFTACTESSTSATRSPPVRTTSVVPPTSPPAISADGGRTWRVDGPCVYFAAAQAPNGVSDIGARAPDWAYAWGRGAQAVKVTHDGGVHWFVSFLPPIRKIIASGHTLRASLWHSTSTYVSRDYGLTWGLYQPGL